jgi:hypothetical protein
MRRRLGRAGKGGEQGKWGRASTPCAWALACGAPLRGPRRSQRVWRTWAANRGSGQGHTALARCRRRAGANRASLGRRLGTGVERPDCREAWGRPVAALTEAAPG